MKLLIFFLLMIGSAIGELQCPIGCSRCSRLFWDCRERKTVPCASIPLSIVVFDVTGSILAAKHCGEIKRQCPKLIRATILGCQQQESSTVVTSPRQVSFTRIFGMTDGESWRKVTTSPRHYERSSTVVSVGSTETNGTERWSATASSVRPVTKIETIGVDGTSKTTSINDPIETSRISDPYTGLPDMRTKSFTESIASTRSVKDSAIALISSTSENFGVTPSSSADEKNASMINQSRTSKWSLFSSIQMCTSGVKWLSGQYAWTPPIFRNCSQEENVTSSFTAASCSDWSLTNVLAIGLFFGGMLSAIMIGWIVRLLIRLRRRRQQRQDIELGLQAQPQFKVVVIGESRTGKSSLLLRQIEDIFDPDLPATIGVDYRRRTVAGVKLSIWDTAGQERYRSLRSSFYRDCKGAIFVYDVTNRTSFARIPQWIDEFQTYVIQAHKIPKILVGNKIDKNNRQIIQEEGSAFAQRHAMIYMESSARTSAGVNHIFEELITRMQNM